MSLLRALPALVVLARLAVPAAAQSGSPGPDPTAANSAFLAQDWPASAAAYQSIVDADSTNGMAWLRLGVSYLNLNQPERARHPLQRAQVLQFNPMIVHIALARVAAADHDRASALQHLREGVALGYATARVLERDPNMAALKGDRVYDSLVARMNDMRYPCHNGAEQTQSDFWLGSWNVFLGANQVGTNNISKRAEGCILVEDWQSPGQTGMSVNYYDPTRQQWHQLFIFDNGAASDWWGALVDGRMVLTSTGPGTTPGTTSLSRMTFTRLSADSVTQVIEVSADSGKTWTTPWNSVYVRRK
jgi:hypothetical protein